MQVVCSNCWNFAKERNREAQELQRKYEAETPENREALVAEIRRHFIIDYAIHDIHNNKIAGYSEFLRAFDLISPNVEKVYYGSSTSFEARARGGKPANHFGIWLNFERPPLTLNSPHFPSNPTENNSIVNVFGFDEEWVILTERKFHAFFENKKSNLQILHRSGIYDAYLYLIFIPTLIWISTKLTSSLPTWSTFSYPILLISVYG
jgi:hypothetical protein